MLMEYILLSAAVIAIDSLLSTGGSTDHDQQHCNSTRPYCLLIILSWNVPFAAMSIPDPQVMFDMSNDLLKTRIVRVDGTGIPPSV